MVYIGMYFVRVNEIGRLLMRLIGKNFVCGMQAGAYIRRQAMGMSLKKAFLMRGICAHGSHRYPLNAQMISQSIKREDILMGVGILSNILSLPRAEQDKQMDFSIILSMAVPLLKFPIPIMLKRFSLWLKVQLVNLTLFMTNRPTNPTHRQV